MVRQTDLLARIGGDVFVLFIDDIRFAPASSEAIARKLIQALAAPLCYSSQEFSVGLSIGISSSTARWHPEELMLAAGEAMSVAKRTGGNRWCRADVRCISRG